MKCSTCGKIIQHPYHLDGKVYGYNCYRQALSLKYANLKEMHNKEYMMKCSALIEVFNQKIFKNKWNNDFKDSILKQWNSCQKLTSKQFNCIFKKLNDKEYVEYNLIYFELTDKFNTDSFKKELEELHIFHMLEEKKELYNFFKNDKRLYNLIKIVKEPLIKKGKNFYIVEYKDIYIKNSICEIIKEKQLEELKTDEDIEIFDIIEIK